jgi:hypothetical protein
MTVSEPFDGSTKPAIGARAFQIIDTIVGPPIEEDDEGDDNSQ